MLGDSNARAGAGCALEGGGDGGRARGAAFLTCASFDEPCVAGKVYFSLLSSRLLWTMLVMREPSPNQPGWLRQM